MNFFGRRALVEQLLTRFEKPAESTDVPTDRFLAVVGPSGSGKSSVVKAGLLPALRRGAVLGSKKWFMVEMIPGTHPLEELEAALLSIAVDPPDSLLPQLQEDDRGLVKALEKVLPEDESELLLMIDQFEELYTLVQDDERRTHFITTVLAALHEPDSRLRVVVTLRADFYDRPLMTPGLAELMRSCMEIVPPLTKTELEEVIVQPALQVGAIFEDGLVPAIIDDVSEQPGALPLLQYAMTELFERRQERLLTLAAYQEIGGVLGALGRRAEELYAELDEQGQEAARQLFMRLVTLGEGTEDTRRRVLRSELTALGMANVMDTVIDAYGRYRLLTFDHDPVTREPTIEVAHEALLREWERLRLWLDDSRDDVRLQRSLATFAAEWSANEEDEGFLLRGSRLDLLAGWAATTTLALTPEEGAFLRASAAARAQRRLAEQERQRRELETAQQLAREQAQRAEEQSRSANRLRLLVAGLAVVLLLAIGAAWLAVRRGQEAQANADLAANREAEALDEANQRATAQAQAESASQRADAERDAAVSAQATAVAAGIRADEQRDTALAAEEEAVEQAEIARFNEAQAQSLALTAGAKEALTGGRVDLALALAVEAVNIEQPPTEAVRTLNDVAFSYGTRFVYENEDQDNYIDIWPVLPEGSTVISQDSGRTLTVWDSNSHEMLNQFDVANEDVTFSRLVTIPDSTYIVTGYNNNEVVVWDWSTGEKVQTWSDIDMVNVDELLAGPEGNSVIYTSRYGGSETEVEGLPAGFNLTAWDIESGEQIYRIDGERGERITWVEATPDNKTALLGTSLIDEEYEYAGGSRLRIVDPETGDFVSEPALSELAGNNIISSVAINPAGDQAFLTTRDPDTSEFGKTGLFISLPAGEVLATVAFDEEAAYANYSPDGSLLAVERDTPSNNYFTLFDALTGEQLRQFGSANEGHIKIVNKGGFTFTPDGKRLVSADQAGGVLVWDVETGEITQRLFGHGGESIFSVIVSPDGQTAITAGGSLLRFWDIAVDTTAQDFEEHGTDSIMGLAISPDGKKVISTSLFAPDEAANEAILWDTNTFEVIHRLPGSYGSAEFLPDGSSAVLGEDLDRNYFWDGDLEMALVHWDLESGKVLNRTVIPDSAVAVDMKMSPDGKSLLAGTISNNLVYFDVETFTLLNRLTSNDEAEWFISTAISPDGQTALAGGDLGDIILFDLESGEEIRRYTPGSVTADLAMSTDGEQFVSAGNDHTIVRWNIASGEAIQTYNGHTNEVTNVLFTPDESQIISASADGTLILWDAASGEPLRTFSEHGAFINAVVLSPDGDLAYSAADDGKVIVRPIVPLPIDEILAHIVDNRILHDFTCVERKRYRILPLCDADGVVPESGN